jgi:hypothetical protein
MLRCTLLSKPRHLSRQRDMIGLQQPGHLLKQHIQLLQHTRTNEKGKSESEDKIKINY